nr:MAG TPA_asm: hypothetical protein [Caudoviricetes sp.]
MSQERNPTRFVAGPKKQVRAHGMPSYTVIRCPLYLEDEEREIQNEN